MKRPISIQQVSSLLVLGAMLLLPRLAQAGPPLVCHHFDIGGARSLPWGAPGASSDKLFDVNPRLDYDLSQLATETLGLLTPATPVIVRMETLRRATIYAQKDPRVAKELFLALQTRTQGHSDALGAFDFGYLIECFKQANWSGNKRDSNGRWIPEERPNAASGQDGYALVEKAIQMRGQDPGMEFAAALIAQMGNPTASHDHLQKAVKGAIDGSLLARNLVLHFAHDGTTMAELRSQVLASKF